MTTTTPTTTSTSTSAALTGSALFAHIGARVAVLAGWVAWLATTAEPLARLADLGGQSWTWLLPVALACLSLGHLAAAFNPASQPSVRQYAAIVAAAVILLGAAAGMAYELAAPLVATDPAGDAATALQAAVRIVPVVAGFAALQLAIMRRIVRDDEDHDTDPDSGRADVNDWDDDNDDQDGHMRTVRAGGVA